MVQILEVPTGLIMRVHKPTIQVVIASSNENNPFYAGADFPIEGVYCERVIDTGDTLLVPNALKDPEWDHNPDLEFDQISYLGFPIVWPNGDPFGTLCVSDTKENNYSELFRQLMQVLREYIECTLTNLFQELQMQMLPDALESACSVDEIKKAINNLAQS